MIAAMLVLSLAGVRNETPNRPAGKVECLNANRVSPKTDTRNEVGTDKCIIVPERSKAPTKVQK